MVWKLILYISAPLSFIKTGVSIVQFYAAMQSIAAIDAASRKKILEPWHEIPNNVVFWQM